MIGPGLAARLRIARAATVVALASRPAAPPVRHFINLSNGMEALPLLAKAGVNPAEVSAR